MVVAYYMPHNDGVAFGIMDEPGQDTGTSLVDLYEVDGIIRTFADRDEAEAWLKSKRKGHPRRPVTVTEDNLDNIDIG